MACDGIGIFDLQRIEIRILLHFFQSFPLLGYVEIVLHDIVEQPLVLLMGKCRCRRLKRVEQHRRIQFKTLIIRKRECAVGKMETEQFPHVSYPLNLRYITIRHKFRLISHLFLLVPTIRWLSPEIIVLGNHDHVARLQFPLPEKDLVSYSIIIDIRPFVRPAHHHSLLHAIVLVAIC